MTLAPYRLINRVSVRVRIILLAAIPVLAFIVNGIAYGIGEHEVSSAFRTADRATELADLSREFRGALVAMRVRTRDFVAHPSQEIIQSFATIRDTAGR